MSDDFRQKIVNWRRDGAPNMSCPRNKALFGFTSNYYDYFEY